MRTQCVLPVKQEVYFGFLKKKSAGCNSKALARQGKFFFFSLPGRQELQPVLKVRGATVAGGPMDGSWQQAASWWDPSAWLIEQNAMMI